MEIRNWLSEYKTLTDEKKAVYGEGLRTNDSLIDELYDLFEEELDAETIDPVCHQMFDFYRSGNPHLKRFVLDFVPTFLSTYFASLSSNGSFKHRSSSLETCLLGIYNLDSGLERDKSRMEKITIPSIHQPSVYHEPLSSTNSIMLTEAILDRQRTKACEINTLPLPYIERINSQNRSFVIGRVLKLFNAEISNILPKSYWSLCKFCCRLSHSQVESGEDTFEDACSEEIENETATTSEIPKTPETPTSNCQHLFCNDTSTPVAGYPYFHVESDVLLELLMSLYYIMHNGDAENALMALESIHCRAMYDLMPDVLLATEAMKHSVRDLKNDVNEILGIPLTLSPNLTHPNASTRDAITNASFRTQKLPDDIDVPDGADQLSVRDSPISSDHSDKKMPKLNIKIPAKKKSTPKKSGVKDLLGAKSPKHSVSVSTGLSTTGVLSGSTDTKLVAAESKLISMDMTQTGSKLKEGVMSRSASNKAVSDDDQLIEMCEVSIQRSIFGSKMASRDDDDFNRRFSEVPKLASEAGNDLEKVKGHDLIKYSRHTSARQVPEAGDC